MARRISDPVGAITVARTLLGDVWKRILDDVMIAYERNPRTRVADWQTARTHLSGQRILCLLARLEEQQSAKLVRLRSRSVVAVKAAAWAAGVICPSAEWGARD
jgi:hypothetical protein